MEELESEIASMKNDFDVAKAKYATVASTVVDHDDRANVLQFKLQGVSLGYRWNYWIVFCNTFCFHVQLLMKK